MDVIYNNEWDTLKNYSALWQYNPSIAIEDRDLAVWKYPEVSILPKFFIKNNINELNCIPEGIEIVNRSQYKNKLFDFNTTNFNVAFEPRPEQQPVFDTLLEVYDKEGSVNGIIQAKPGVGKGHPYSEPILSINGWTTLSELKVGSYVIDHNGNPTKVTQIHELGKRDLYEFTFSDNSTSICTYDHLWKFERDFKSVLKQTSELILENDFTKYSLKLNSSIKPIIQSTLSISSYIIGLILNKRLILIDNKLALLTQEDDVERVLKEIILTSFPETTYEIHKNFIIVHSKLLNALNVLKVFENPQQIFNIYMNTSPQIRELLLYGYLNLSSQSLVKTVELHESDELNKRDNIIEISRSLGMYVITLENKIVIDSRVKEKRLLNIKKLIYKENSRCISVESKDHLYITRDYNVTHNTYMSIKLSSIFKLQTICVVPNSILEDQWINEIADFANIPKSDIGVIQGSNIAEIEKNKVLEKEIIVVKIQTLLSQLKRIGHEELIKFYSKIGLVFFDECHQSGAAESYAKTSVMFKTNNIIGLSATPFVKGINELLMHNSIGKILIELDHQNLIPTVTLHQIPVAFTEKEIARLSYLKSDYIKFLAIHNMILEEKDSYLEHLADWVVYRQQQGHISAILFATNKMVYKMHRILIKRGLDVGVITGSTKKKLEISVPYLTETQVSIFRNEYQEIFPKRAKIPEFKRLKNDKTKFKITSLIMKDINKMKIKFPSISHHMTKVNNQTEREIMSNKSIIVSNFKMLTTGYSREELSHIMIGTPLVGAIPSIQVAGRTTRKSDNKIQDIQAQFFFTDLYLKLFPTMHHVLVNNLKKGYETSTYKYEGFNFEK